MTEWKRSLKVYILQKCEERSTKNKIEISEVSDFDLTLFPLNPFLVVPRGIELNQYWALRVEYGEWHGENSQQGENVLCLF